MTHPWSFDPDPTKREIARVHEQNAKRAKDAWNKPKNNYQGSGKNGKVTASDAATFIVKSALDHNANRDQRPPKPKTAEEIETENAIIGGLFVAGAAAGTLYAATQLTIHYPFHVAAAVSLPAWFLLKAGIDEITAYDFPVASGVISAVVTATSLYFGANYINDNFKPAASAPPESQLQDNRQYPTIALVYNKGSGAFARLNTNLSTARTEALSACRSYSADRSSCHVRATFEGGSPMCIDYGAIVYTERTTNSRNEPDYRIISTEYFIGFTNNKTEDNKATAACMETGKFSACKDRNSFRRTCNF